MNPDTLLSRLELVRQTGPDRWSARCPAHLDKTPSLSIRMTEDRLLVFCHAGCEVQDILAAIGLDWGDICPARARPYEQALAAGHRRQRRRLADINLMDYARLVLRIAAADLERGRAHSLEDRATIELAREVLRDGR